MLGLQTVFRMEAENQHWQACMRTLRRKAVCRRAEQASGGPYPRMVTTLSGGAVQELKQRVAVMGWALCGQSV